MNKRTLLNATHKIAEIILSYCETDEDIKQIKEAIEKYVNFTDSIHSKEE